MVTASGASVTPLVCGICRGDSCGRAQSGRCRERLNGAASMEMEQAEKTIKTDSSPASSTTPSPATAGRVGGGSKKRHMCSCSSNASVARRQTNIRYGKYVTSTIRLLVVLNLAFILKTAAGINMQQGHAVEGVNDIGKEFRYLDLLRNYPDPAPEILNTRRKREISAQNKSSCSHEQLLAGQWMPHDKLIDLYSKELEREGSLWRLDKGMPEVYYSDKIHTCGYGKPPVLGEKYKGNMWCNPHDKERSCCLDQFCVPSEECAPREDKQRIQQVNFFENKPIDFSDFTWPELSGWEPSNCAYRPRTSKGACDILQNNKAGIRHLYFVGDSLTLNFYIGFMSHITGDYKYGPLEPARAGTTCSGFQELLYKRSDCKVLPKSSQTPNYACDGTTVTFIDIRNRTISLVENAINEAREAKTLDQSLFVINAGTHEKFRYDVVIKKILEPVIDQLPRKNLLWLSQVRPSFNVPLKYNRKQSAWLRMKEFYQKMARWTQVNDVNALDLQSISANAFSPDGTHYSMGVQLMKVQVLLQYLEDMKQHYEPPQHSRRTAVMQDRIRQRRRRAALRAARLLATSSTV